MVLKLSQQMTEKVPISNDGRNTASHNLNYSHGPQNFCHFPFIVVGLTQFTTYLKWDPYSTQT